MTSATKDPALAHLRALLEVNAQIARERHHLGSDERLNDEVSTTLGLVTRTAAAHSDELAELIHEWERATRGGRVREERVGEEVVTPRDLIESWLAIKESAAEIYRAAAEDAPSGPLKRRLRDLAHEDEMQAERLRRLL